MLQFLNGILAAACFALSLALAAALSLAHRFSPQMIAALPPEAVKPVLNLIASLWFVVVLIGVGTIARASYAILGPGTAVSVATTSILIVVASFACLTVGSAVWRLHRSAR